jgi:Phasin protein
MAKANEPSTGRRRDRSRRAVRRAADAANPPRTTRTTRTARAARSTTDDQRPDEARAPQAISVPGAAGRRVEAGRSKPRVEDAQQGKASAALSEGVTVASAQAVAPPAGEAQDPAPLVAAEADPAAGSPVAVSGPTGAAAPAAPMLDEGAAAREATGSGEAPVSDRGAVAARDADRPSPAPLRPVPGGVPVPERAIQAFAAGSTRLQEETLAFVRAQVEDVARTGQALATCTSPSAALALQVQAASRQFARCVAHGQTLASIGREMWQSLGRPNQGKAR